VITDKILHVQLFMVMDSITMKRDSNSRGIVTVHTLLLQVGKCEKFGYGCMMSHVAATAPGMVALRNTGRTEF